MGGENAEDNEGCSAVNTIFTSKFKHKQGKHNIDWKLGWLPMVKLPPDFP